MHALPTVSVLVVGDCGDREAKAFLAYLGRMPHMQPQSSLRLPDDLSQWQVVVTAGGQLDPTDVERLAGFLKSGGGWLHLIRPAENMIPALLGVEMQPAGQPSELRVMFDRSDHPLAVRLPDAFYIRQPYLPMKVKSEEVQQVLYADWQYRHSPVLVMRPHGGGMAACTTLQDLGHPVLRQILYRLVYRLGASPEADRRLGVGILGYPPWLGPFHGQGVVYTPGLELAAICDFNPERLRQARADFPRVQTVASAESLIREAKVDLVIIATPPNTHAPLALQMMNAGKHVVCEKPLALDCARAGIMAETAARLGVHLSCHQNRRWDVDYLAIKQVLDGGLIGDIFYLETFVGGFVHPCGFWHSETSVSGGTTFDWGGHYIDWIVSLCRGPVRSVVGTRHKRVWHDVTNADQERIQIRFADGREAEFMHSDIAAARKPKWYLLGTRGALVGQWRDVTAYRNDPLHYFQSHDFPVTEIPPDLTVFQHGPTGKTTVLKPAIPDRPMFGFHHNLADHLLTGEPLTAPLEDSVRVVAILEAAARSMVNGGTVEVLDG